MRHKSPASHCYRRFVKHFCFLNNVTIVTHRAWPDEVRLPSILAVAHDPKTLFGRRLAQLRKKRHWSQERLSLESGVARSYLGGVERGKRNISLMNICRLADTLELPPSALLQFKSVRKLRR